MYTREEINEALQEITNQIIELGYEVVGIFLQGSQNYLLDTEDSDIDVKVFVKPSWDDLYNDKKVSKVYQTKYGQAEVKDIRRFPELVKKANPSYIELFFTEYMYCNNDLYDLIMNIRNKVVIQNAPRTLKSMYGMMKQKYKNLSNPTPSRKEIVELWGYDPKQFYHLMRLYYMAGILIKNNFKSYKEALYLDDHSRNMLMGFKTQELDLDTVQLRSEDAIDKMKLYVDYFIENFEYSGADYNFAFASGVKSIIAKDYIFKGRQ